MCGDVIDGHDGTRALPRGHMTQAVVPGVKATVGVLEPHDDQIDVIDSREAGNLLRSLAADKMVLEGDAIDMRDRPFELFASLGHLVS